MTMAGHKETMPAPARPASTCPASTCPMPVQRALRGSWFLLAWIALGRVGIVDFVAGLAASVRCGELSLRVLPPAPHGPDPKVLGRFVLHFLRRSAASGLEPARWLLHPGAPLAPGVLAVDCGPAPGLAR